MKKTYKNIVVLVSLIILLVGYFINSKLVIYNILDYSKLFLTKLFPVSFLFFIMSTLIINYGLIEVISYYLNINSSSLFVFILSMISGFPSGAKYSKDLLLTKRINTKEANQIIKFSHFPNPLFVFGSVSTILNNSLSLKILIAIYLSNLIIFLFNKKTSSIKLDNKEINSFSQELSKAIKESLHTIILIYGTSVFFYLIVALITKYIYLNTYFYIFINGLFDLTKGVFSTTLISNINIRTLFILFFISFGGISIHMQVKSILLDTSISYCEFLKGRIIGTILAFIILFILLLF